MIINSFKSNLIKYSTVDKLVPIQWIAEMFQVVKPLNDLISEYDFSMEWYIL